ncbi:MAG: phosphonopyruvate decarboxylase [Flavobacteriaceae bacterium]
MISVKKYFEVFINEGIGFFTGVPDSVLKFFTSYIDDKLKAENHVITANEGAAIALATGYHLATNKVPVVYMQNSGLGNAVNPLVSLVGDKVYKIPLILIIGWRGEPSAKDEPQHLQQGKITLQMLELMDIPFIILNENEQDSISRTAKLINDTNKLRKTHAILIKRNLFSSYKLKLKKGNEFQLSREDAMKVVVQNLGENDVVVSTTGKLSRELFEYRESIGQNHESDFLTVGSMGHASMIALGIAREKENKNVYCFDGDGAVLMHAGSLSNIGDSGLKNYKHIVFNNGAHESVGGQKTLALDINMSMFAKANGYSNVKTISKIEDLKEALKELKSNGELSFLEIKVKIESRQDLGRPTTSPVENKIAFMNKLMTND